MRYTLLLVLAAGCMPTVTMKELHPDWPEEISSLVVQAKIRTGMTREQVECSLGIGVWGCHYHKEPDYAYSRGRVLVAHYWLDKDKMGLPRQTIIATYVDGILENSDQSFRNF